MQGEEKNVLMDLDSKYVAVEGGGYVYLPEDVRIAALDPLEGRVSTGQYRMRFNAFGGFEGGDLILWNKKKTVRVKMDPILGAAYLK
jgi:hypothetical protein